VQLEGAFPPVWRRVEAASDLGLDDLHDVLQVVFGWEDYHLHRFTTGPERDPGEAFACTADLAEAFDDDPAVPTWDVRVDELLAEPGERLHYQYDYGDNWWVALEVEDVIDGHVPPGRAALLEGAGAGPPEDCGGIDGYRMIVAASDPTHPDHRQALAEVGEWWGREVAPDELGLVAFDPASVDVRLQALDLAGRPPVPRRLSPKLAALLLRVRDGDTDRQLRAWASTAGGDEDVVEETTAARVVRTFTVLLATVGDGVKLTAAGYLPPTVVQTVFDELDLGDEWIGKGNREDLTVPVHQLREAAQQLKLLRKYKGRLVPTARGRQLAGDPVGLWCHLADALPLGGRDAADAGWQAGVLLLALMATGSTDNAEVTVAKLLTALGWAVGDGQPIDRRTATGLIAEDVHLLRQLGAFERDRRGGWPGTVTPDGIALARAALNPPEA
jgi:hypothetical protein